jgi:general L-amino acid transport system permease protein
MRRNLFKSRVDTVMTIVIGLILLWFLGSLFRWAVTEARWAVITENLSTLMRGIYPQEQIQRVTAAVLLVVGLTGLSWGVWGRRFTQIGAVFLTLAVVLVVAPLFQRGAAEAGSLGAYLDMQLLPLIDVLRVPLLQLMLILCLGALVGFAVRRLNYEVVSRGLVVLWFMAIPVVLLLIRGLSPETPLVPLVPTNLWGGLLLTFMLAFVASVFCFPLGIALALAGELPGHQVLFDGLHRILSRHPAGDGTVYSQHPGRVRARQCRD